MPCFIRALASGYQALPFRSLLTHFRRQRSEYGSNWNPAVPMAVSEIPRKAELRILHAASTHLVRLVLIPKTHQALDQVGLTRSFPWALAALGTPPPTPPNAASGGAAEASEQTPRTQLRPSIHVLGQAAARWFAMLHRATRMPLPGRGWHPLAAKTWQVRPASTMAGELSSAAAGTSQCIRVSLEAEGGCTLM